jgi:hypothetical protein
MVIENDTRGKGRLSSRAPRPKSAPASRPIKNAARRRFTLLKEFVEYFGLEPGRLNFSWVSASEGGKYAEVIKTVVERVRELGPARRMVKEYAGADET